MNQALRDMNLKEFTSSGGGDEGLLLYFLFLQHSLFLNFRDIHVHENKC